MIFAYYSPRDGKLAWQESCYHNVRAVVQDASTTCCTVICSNALLERPKCRFLLLLLLDIRGKRISSAQIQALMHVRNCKRYVEEYSSGASFVQLIRCIAADKTKAHCFRLLQHGLGILLFLFFVENYKVSASCIEQ